MKYFNVNGDVVSVSESLVESFTVKNKEAKEITEEDYAVAVDGIKTLPALASAASAAIREKFGGDVFAAVADLAAKFDGTDATGELTDGSKALAVDNFQDVENVPFSLKLRNQTGDALNGVTAVIENVPYSAIENVKSEAKIAHTVTKGGTGYTHTFELLEALAAYDSVNIDGDKLDVFGVGSADGNPKLYIK